MTELLAALEAASQPGSETGVTTMDIKAATGWPERRITQALGRLKEEGRLGVKTVYRINLHGVAHPRPAYYLRREEGEEQGAGSG